MYILCCCAFFKISFIIRTKLDFIPKSIFFFCSTLKGKGKNSTAQGESNSTTLAQLRARRKASKMLVAVVIMFAACYFPVHALNVIRYTYTDLNQSEIVSVLSLLSHWLCYANSAINPLIYNFMSGKCIPFKYIFCNKKIFSGNNKNHNVQFFFLIFLWGCSLIT